MLKKRDKILLVASHGGHWAQMRKIARALDDLPLVYVSTVHDSQHEVAPHPHYCVRDANLDEKIGLVVLAVQMLGIILRTRPAFVVSTGAAPGFFALLFGKMIGCKTIWIDSMANAEELSTSGKRVGRLADLWLTQWPHLAQPGGPEYRGSVL